MSDVLQLDYFTCASLMTEARDDFDTAEHKPVIRGLVAYYGAMGSILRASFFLARLRRDSRRCPITGIVDSLLRTVGLGDATLDGLLSMAAEEGAVVERARAFVPTVALEAELQYLSAFRTQDSPPRPLFSGDGTGVREREVLAGVLESAQQALADCV